jgi:hypothetical protein
MSLNKVIDVRALKLTRGVIIADGSIPDLANF